MGAEVASISKTGEMLVLLDRHMEEAFIRAGTLAQVSVSGGVAPRPISTDVEWADWAPDGSELRRRPRGQRAKAARVPGRQGSVPDDWLDQPSARVAQGRPRRVPRPSDPPRRRRIGRRSSTARARRRVLAGVYSSVEGLAWTPDGEEIWFTGTRTGGNRAIHSVSISGAERLLARVTESLTIQDIAADGRVLVSHDVIRIGVLGRGPGDKERDLSWLDWSAAFDLTPDGKTLLFAETGEGSGSEYSCFIRGTDGSPPVRLGDGVAMATLARRAVGDGEYAAHRKAALWLYPIGAGDKKLLPTGNLGVESSADWTRDGESIVFTASEPGRGARVFTIAVAGGPPKALTPEGYRLVPRTVSPDGKTVVVIGPDRKRYFYRWLEGSRRRFPVSRTTRLPPAGAGTAGPSTSSVAGTFRRGSFVSTSRPASASSGRSSIPATGRGFRTSPP